MACPAPAATWAATRRSPAARARIAWTWRPSSPISTRSPRMEPYPPPGGGPMVSGAIRQFYTDMNWGDLDYLLVDLPPGTSDAPMTVMQQLPTDGAVLVSTPQGLATMVVSKAIQMVKKFEVPIVGVVEN